MCIYGVATCRCEVSDGEQGKLQRKMHLLSTACTAERREKSHRHDACGRQEKTCVSTRERVSRPFVSSKPGPGCKTAHVKPLGLSRPGERLAQNYKHGALNTLDSDSCLLFLLLAIEPGGEVNPASTTSEEQTAPARGCRASPQKPQQLICSSGLTKRQESYANSQGGDRNPGQAKKMRRKFSC